MTLTLTAFGASDRGLVRDRNEDHFLADAEEGILVVADGLGGRPSGEVASAIAARAAHAVLTSRTWDEGRGDAMEEAVQAANREVALAAQSQADMAGMGTTLTILAIRPQEGTFTIGHVGDSRAYRLRDGVLEQLTHDHTVAQQLLDDGKIQHPDISAHPFRHLLSRAVGTDRVVDVEVFVDSAEPADLFLLCTDGLIAVLDDEAIARALSAATPQTLAAVGEELIRAANEGGGPDNVTVGLLAVT